ncbi:sugar MFS transporter [Acidobacteria bacterium AB60]|nr:sugar MFS transporter [Acidobacteria bacterium AB60]
MATSSTSQNTATPSYVGPFIIVSILFFVFGFLTTLNTFLAPLVQAAFDTDNFQANLINAAFFVAYLLFATPTARLINSVGYKRTMIISLFTMAVGTVLFIPASSTLVYVLFLTAILVLAAGIAALQTSANPYVAVLGPEHSAPARLTLAQAFNSVGAALSGNVAGKFILAKVLTPEEVKSLTPDAHHAYQVQMASAVQKPYLFFTAALVILALAVAFAKLPSLQATREFRAGKEGDPVLDRSIWGFRHTVLAAVAIFCYVGVEVGLGTNMVKYFTMPDIGAYTAAKAAALVSTFYWGGALVGRLLGSWLLSIFNPNRLLAIFGVAAAAVVLISIATTGQVAVWSIILAGFFNSIMFPNIFALGTKGLGPLTSKGSGLIMSGVVGGAIVGPILGKIQDFSISVQNLAETTAFKHSFVVAIVCYLFIAYYGLWGSKPARTVQA